MTEVVKEEIKDKPVEKVEEVVVMSPTETSARDAGWVSEEEWVEQGKAADDWVSAKEFVRVGDIYKSLHQNKRELKQTQAQLDALRRHNTYIFEKAYQTAKDDLRKEKRQAIREGDLEKLEDIETQMEELVDTHVKEKETIQAQPQVQNQEFDQFINRNTWYSDNPEMRTRADFEGWKYLNAGGDRADLFTHVEKEVRKAYPDKFGVRRAAPNAIVSGDKTLKAGRTATFELDEMETQIMDSLVSSGEMTKAEYIASLKKAKGVK